jgi:hypothetical protein
MAKHRRPPPTLFPEPAAAMPVKPAPASRPADRSASAPAPRPAPRPAAQKDDGRVSGPAIPDPVAPTDLPPTTWYITAAGKVVGGPTAPGDAVLFAREGERGWRPIQELNNGTK